MASTGVPPLDNTNYSFNSEGKLVHNDTGEHFVFSTQEDYERLGNIITEMIYDMLMANPYSLRCRLLDGRDVTEIPRAKLPRDETFIFASKNLETANTLVVIIHGSGVVRAGQWARRLIINESIELGTQLPYIRCCIDRGWAVLVTNTNDTFYVDEITGGKKLKFGSSTPEEHGVNVWSRFVDGLSIAKRVFIIAHSYGGVVTTKILKTFDTARIKGICLTDAIFKDGIFNSIGTPIPCRNWVRSQAPLDTPLCGTHVSAGTENHERTSASAIESVFKFLINNTSD